MHNEGDTYDALSKAAKKIEAAYWSALCARHDGSPGGHGAHQQRQMWIANTSVAGRARPRRPAAEAAGRQGHRQRHLARWRLRAQSKADFIVEAALVSQAMEGKPVKLTWTREDDLHHDYFHAVYGAAPRRPGSTPTARSRHGCTHLRADNHVDLHTDPKQLAVFELRLGRVPMPYAIPNVRIENPAATAHARIGWLRSVNNIQHAFASQSFVAELAQAQGKDHRDFLLELMGPTVIDPTTINEPGTMASRQQHSRSTPVGYSKVIERRDAKRPTGAASCRGARPGRVRRRTTVW